MKFKLTAPDYTRSPLTGMTRRHWKESAVFLLQGVFSQVADRTAPLIFPRRSEVMYPATEANWATLRAAEAEGLARTFLLAAPLLAEDSALQIGGLALRDYYAEQILRACDPASAAFWGSADEVAQANGGRPGQQMVEVAALCLGLMSCRSVLWDRYAAAEKEMIVKFLADYAQAETHSHNWRFFNVMIGAFLQVQGYAVDEAMLDGHLQALMAWYAGDGWYRDGAQFDYYSPWAFQFYGPIWCEWIGRAWRPEVAAIIAQRHGELMEVYPYFFSRTGESLLWGRSAAYRCAASAPLVVAWRLGATSMDPGWARRIASGNLLQFIAREDIWQDGIPGPGFYRPFYPALQSYSCAASPFWLAKIYQALVLPADSPFWTATENEGVWATLKESTETAVLKGPGLVASLHGRTGAAECRPGKVSAPQGLYQRLAFNTAFPWEADDPAGAVAMTYALRPLENDEPFTTPVAMQYAGVREGVLYRRIYFSPRNNSPFPAMIDLAEIILPGGMLRIDRVRVPHPYELHLGHFGLPHMKECSPEMLKVPFKDGMEMTGRIPGRQLRLRAYQGWDSVEHRIHRGKNAEADVSTVIHAVRRRTVAPAGVDLVITLMLHCTDDAVWTDEAAGWIEDLQLHAWSGSGSPGGVTVRLKGLGIRTVDFGNLEGELGT